MNLVSARELGHFGHRDFFKQAGDDVFGGHALGLGLKVGAEAVAEDEAAFEDQTLTAMEIPTELVPVVRELLAKHQP